MNGECVVLEVRLGVADRDGSLHVGDILHAINGTPCGSAADFKAALRGIIEKPSPTARPRVLEDHVDPGHQAFAARGEERPSWSVRNPKTVKIEAESVVSITVTLSAMRRPVTTLESDVLLDALQQVGDVCNGGELNRTVSYEQRAAHRGRIRLGEIVNVRLVNRQAGVTGHTQHEKLTNDTPDSYSSARHRDAPSVRSRCKLALAPTRADPDTCGNGCGRADAQGLARYADETEMGGGTLGFNRFYFTLYANGALLYFADGKNPYPGRPSVSYSWYRTCRCLRSGVSM